MPGWLSPRRALLVALCAVLAPLLAAAAEITHFDLRQEGSAALVTVAGQDGATTLILIDTGRASTSGRGAASCGTNWQSEASRGPISSFLRISTRITQRVPSHCSASTGRRRRPRTAEVRVSVDRRWQSAAFCCLPIRYRNTNSFAKNLFPPPKRRTPKWSHPHRTSSQQSRKNTQ